MGRFWPAYASALVLDYLLVGIWKYILLLIRLRKCYLCSFGRIHNKHVSADGVVLAKTLLKNLMSPLLFMIVPLENERL